MGEAVRGLLMVGVVCTAADIGTAPVSDDTPVFRMPIGNLVGSANPARVAVGARRRRS